MNEDQYQYDTIITAGKLLDEIIPMKLPKEFGEYLVQAYQICCPNKESYIYTSSNNLWDGLQMKLLLRVSKENYKST